MSVTLSYDLRTNNANHRTYIRSMLERFAWTRLGGSVFRYDGRIINKKREEDWLNDVVPALMFFRSYVLRHNIEVRFMTIDSHSVARIDFSDPNFTYGRQPLAGTNLSLRTPTNNQSSVARLKRFVDGAAQLIP